MNSFAFVLILLFWVLPAYPQTPELPHIQALETCFPDTAGYTVWTVGPVNRDFNSLQAALDAVHPGSILLLDAGTAFQGSFLLPEKTGEGWVILMSAEMQLLPGQGKRIEPGANTGAINFPTQRDAMPRIVSTNPAGLPCFHTEASAHHYRLVGLEITVDNAVQNSYGLVLLGDGSGAQNTLDKVPHDLILDRCYIHGHSNATIMKSGVLLNASNAAVLDSYIADFHSIGFDTYAIGGTNGPGPFIIRNNYLEAAGENILFGGAAPAIPGLVPADIEVRNNHFFKPFSWRVGHPEYAGKHWTVKNLFELKTGKRVLLDGNIMENCWADLPTGQSGYAILLTVRSEGGNAPQADVSDITISNNVIRHAGAGISLSGHDSPGPSLRSERIRIANNLFEDISGPDYGDGNVAGPNDGTFLKIGDPAEVQLEHNTVFQSGPITWAYDTSNQIIFRNNIFHCFVSDGGYQGIYGPGFAQGGNGPMARYFPDITDAGQQFHKNVLIGGDAARYSNYNTLSQQYFPGNAAAVGFVDYANGGADYLGYALATGSPYKNLGTDGKDLGVDFGALELALQDSAPCTQQVNTSQPRYEAGITVYPNPSSDGVFSMLSKEDLNGAELVVWDLLGREVYRRVVWGRDLQFSISHAVYFRVIQHGRIIGQGSIIEN